MVIRTEEPASRGQSGQDGGQVAFFYDKEAVVTRVTKYHAFVRLKEPQGKKLEASVDENSGSDELSVFVNRIRLPVGLDGSGGDKVRSLENGPLFPGQEVRVCYAAPVGRKPVILFLLTEGASRPDLVQLQQEANELVSESAGSRFYRRLDKSFLDGDVPASDGGSENTSAQLPPLGGGPTPASLMSARSIPSPVDVSLILMDLLDVNANRTNGFK